MAATTTFDAVSNVGSRFYTQRINRRLDDRDNVIKEAIGILEEKDSTYFPTVLSVAVADYSRAALQGTATDSVITLFGSNLGKSTDTITVAIAGKTAGITVSGLDNTNQDAMIITCDNQGETYIPQSEVVGDQHLVQVHINDTLATEFFVTVA